MKPPRTKPSGGKIGMTVMGERGQIVIPKDIREELGLKSGMQLVVLAPDCDKLVIFPADNFKQFMHFVTEKMKDVEKLLKPIKK